MVTRVSYPLEVKQVAIKMKLEGKSTKEIMEKLSIKNRTQIQTWWRWYLNNEEHRFLQPVGKQYTYDKGPEGLSEVDKLQLENKFLKNKISILEKYNELERMWRHNYL